MKHAFKKSVRDTVPSKQTSQYPHFIATHIIQVQVDGLVTVGVDRRTKKIVAISLQRASNGLETNSIQSTRWQRLFRNSTRYSFGFFRHVKFFHLVPIHHTKINFCDVRNFRARKHISVLFCLEGILKLIFGRHRIFSRITCTTS